VGPTAGLDECGNSPLPPRTVQSVAIPYTDRANPAHVVHINKVLIFNTCSFSDHDSIFRNGTVFPPSRSQWPRGLKRRSGTARLLRLWVRTPPGHGYVSCECCVLSGRGLCDELITRLEESYRMWCVVVCDLETL